MGQHFQVGDVVFEPLPIAVAGRVLDGEDRPVSGMGLRVFEQSRSGRLQSLAEGVQTRLDGRFEVRARVTDQAAALVVHARSPGLGSLSAGRIALGREDLVLRFASD